MSILVSLRSLLGVGRTSERNRRTLIKFAQSYQPISKNSAIRFSWFKLMSVLHEGIPDAALAGLQMFLEQSNGNEQACICLSPGCEVAFEVDGGSLCLDAHDNDVLCCPLDAMREELALMIEAHDSTK